MSTHTCFKLQITLIQSDVPALGSYEEVLGALEWGHDQGRQDLAITVQNPDEAFRAIRQHAQHRPREIIEHLTVGVPDYAAGCEAARVMEQELEQERLEGEFQSAVIRAKDQALAALSSHDRVRANLELAFWCLVDARLQQVTVPGGQMPARIDSFEGNLRSLYERLAAFQMQLLPRRVNH